MIVTDEIIGNVHEDESLADKYESYDQEGKVEVLTLGSDERKRSRLRTTTDAGTEIGVIKEKPEFDRGDVLYVDDDRMIIVELKKEEAMVIEYPAQKFELDDIFSAMKLGYDIGNRHWDLLIEGEEIYLPLAEEKSIVESVVEEALPAEATYRYEQVDVEKGTVPPHQHHHSGDHDHEH